MKKAVNNLTITKKEFEKKWRHECRFKYSIIQNEIFTGLCLLNLFI